MTQPRCRTGFTLFLSGLLPCCVETMDLAKCTLGFTQWHLDTGYFLEARMPSRCETGVVLEERLYFETEREKTHRQV